MKITWTTPPPTHVREGTLPNAAGPSYRLTCNRQRWRIRWMPADQKIGTYQHEDAAKAVAQAHADEWDAFGKLWHEREHYGPDPTDDFAREAFNYFRAGLQKGRLESQ